MAGDDIKFEMVGDLKLCVVAAQFPNDGGVKFGRLAYTAHDFVDLLHRGEKSALAGFYGHINGGIKLAEHIFRGLERPLLTDEDATADNKILVYSWKPQIDWDWRGGKFDGNLVKVPLMAESLVLAVLVTPNEKHKERFPTIDGWINTWSWIDEDGELPGAARGWVDRYNEKLWTKGG